MSTGFLQQKLRAACCAPHQKTMESQRIVFSQRAAGAVHVLVSGTLAEGCGIGRACGCCVAVGRCCGC